MELQRKDTDYATDSEYETSYTPPHLQETHRCVSISPAEISVGKGRIHSIQLCNFKSYKGIVQVGPFTRFSAIIGHNGSGKSNIMDAIAFVLCIKSPNFKGPLSELISKSEEPLPAAYVELRLIGSPLAIFRRTVTSKNVVSYFFNGNQVLLKEYHEALLHFKIDIVGNSSLIFQGAITSVVQRNPFELSKLFDTISGSHFLDSQYRDLKANIDKLEYDHHDLCIRKNHLEKQARRYKQMSKNETEFKKLLSKQNALIADKYRWDIKQIDNKIEELESDILDKKEEIDELHTIITARRNEINSLEERLIERERIFRENQDKKLEVQRMQLNLKLKNKMIRAENTALESKKKDVLSKSESIKSNINTAKSNIDSLDEEKNKLLTKLESLNAEVSEDEFSKIASKIDWQAYQSVESHLLTELGEERLILRTLQRKLESEQKELKSLEKNLLAEKIKFAEFNTKSDKLDQLFSQLSLRVKTLESDTLTWEKTIESTAAKIEKLKSDVKEKENQLSEAKELSSLSDLYREELSSNHDRLQLVRRMTSAINGVYGLLSTLFQVEASKNIVLKALSSYLNLVIVKDYDTSLKCVEYLKASKRSYTCCIEILSLDKLPTISKGFKHNYKESADNYRYLINCISFDECYTALFEYLLGSFIIVNSLEDIDFSKNTPNVVYITEKGEIVRGKTITFDIGLSDRLVKEFDVANISARNDKVKELEKELGALEESLFQAEYDLQNQTTKIDKLRWELKISSSKLSACQKPVDYNNQESLIIQESIKSHSNRIENVKLNISTLTSQIEEVSKRIEMVEFQAFRPLSETLGVDNIATLYRDNLKVTHKRNLNIDRCKARLAQIPVESKEIENEIEVLSNKLVVLEKEIEDIDSKIIRVDDDQVLFSDESEEEEGTEDEGAAVQRSLSDLQKKDYEDGKSIEQLKSELCELEQNIQSLSSDRSNLLIKYKTEIGEPFATDYGVVEPNLRELERVQRRLEEICGYGDYSAELVQVENKLNKLKADINRIRDNIDESREKFQKLRLQRKTIFLDFLTLVNSAIPYILRILFNADDYVSNFMKDKKSENIFHITNTIDHSVDEEPFYCPIYYNFSINKHHIDIETSSGGEKSIAGLALILAFQKVKQTPFIVLDEVDAHLDSNYIQGILRYFKESSSQIIAISLKDRVFSKADTLIGVVLSRNIGTSKTVTLDLTKYKAEGDETLSLDD